MFTLKGRIGWQVLAMFVCLCAAAPLAAQAQEAIDQSVALRGSQADEQHADEQRVDEASADASQLEYALPSPDAWQLDRPEVNVGTPIVVAVPPAPVADGLDGAVVEAPLSAEDNAIIDKALATDAATLAAQAPARSLRLPGYTAPKKLDVSRTDQPDGSGTVTLKKPLPIEWDAKVGADLGLAATPKPIYGSDRPLGGPSGNAGSGAAWASVSVPRIAAIDATVDARVDPTNDQGRIGTTFERSLPVGSKFAVKLRSTYSVTETLVQPQVSPADAPAARVWGHEDVAKLEIVPTGTTLGAGVSSTSIDPVTHNTLSAEQKIYGPLQVTTAVTDVGQSGESKSLSARFKLTW